jgi:autoinducer 2-degrading protein
MFVTFVHVHVKPNHVKDFIEACRSNHLASSKEDGNMRFDVLQSADDPNKFILYEAYISADHAAAHKQMPHYLEWREKVANWMAEPREGYLYNGIYPEV